MGFREDNNTLFREGDLREVLEAHYGKAVEKVDSIPGDQFLATPEDVLVEYILSSMLIEPIELHEAARTMEEQETRIDVSNWRV